MKRNSLETAGGETSNKVHCPLSFTRRELHRHLCLSGREQHICLKYCVLNRKSETE